MSNPTILPDCIIATVWGNWYFLKSNNRWSDAFPSKEAAIAAARKEGK
jgi:hypothetical protein